MLQKMGWSAGGLGAAGQGIAEPISGGQIRDRHDQYKGWFDCRVLRSKPLGGSSLQDAGIILIYLVWFQGLNILKLLNITKKT